MAATRTNNSYLADKVALRKNHLPDKSEIRVLDCFSGGGKVWEGVRRLSRKKIIVLPIDLFDYGGFFLPGDNLTYLAGMDLAKYDIIDLDSYGVPFEQLKAVFKKKYRGIVFVTFMQTAFGAMPRELLYAVGFSEEMVTKTPVLCSKHGWEYFCDWLATMGVKSIWHRSHHRKHYLGFSCADLP